jgi:hypothetical protein
MFVLYCVSSVFYLCICLILLLHDPIFPTNCWVEGYLPIIKVGPGCLIGLQLHVTLRYTEGMADMKIQEL